jgi:hypothetical protein
MRVRGKRRHDEDGACNAIIHMRKHFVPEPPDDSGRLRLQPRSAHGRSGLTGQGRGFCPLHNNSKRSECVASARGGGGMVVLEFVLVLCSREGWRQPSRHEQRSPGEESIGQASHITASSSGPLGCAPGTTDTSLNVWHAVGCSMPTIRPPAPQMCWHRRAAGAK